MPRRKINYVNRIEIFYWLIELIGKSKNGLTIDEIERSWNENDDLTDGNFNKSVFKDYLSAIFMIFKIKIGCGSGHTRYRIKEDREIGRMQDWMVRSIAISRTLNRYKDLADRIVLDNMPEIDYLETVMEAMSKGKKLMMLVVDYRDGMERDCIVSPYCLKTYHNRWYLLAKEGNDEPRMLCLDQRIKNVEIANETFNLDKSFSTDDFFEGYFGVRVNHPDDGNPNVEHIVLRAYRDQRFKIKNQPIHHSQKEGASGVSMFNGKEWPYTDFSLNLRPTYDFVSYLESLGRYIEVMEPLSLREELLRVHRDAIERNRI